MNFAEGSTDDIHAHPEQSYYIASVGKLFTSVLVSVLYEQEKLSFDDKISKFLDNELLNKLHIGPGILFLFQLDYHSLKIFQS